MNDVPLGFGTAAKSTLDCRKLDPSGASPLAQEPKGTAQGEAGARLTVCAWSSHGRHRVPSPGGYGGVPSQRGGHGRREG